MTVGYDATIANDLTVENLMTVNDIATFNSNVVIQSNLNVGYDAFIGNDISVENMLTVFNSATFGSNVAVQCNLEVGNITIVKSLTTYDVATFNSNVIITGNLEPSNVFCSNGIFKIPSGSENERPSSNSSPLGSIYFNTDTSKFEGLHGDLTNVDTRIWKYLGGDDLVVLDPSTGTVDFFAENKDVSLMTLDSNMLLMNVDLVMSNTTTLYGSNASLSNLSVSNLHVTGEINYDDIHTINVTTELGNINVTGDLHIEGVLTFGESNTEFPLIPVGEDVSKILGVNRDSNYELMTLFHERRACEFKSLFGRFQTGIELTQFSGLFDFGVPKSWLSGWKATLFDGASNTTEPTGIIPPGSSSNINTDSITIIETFQTNGMEFKDFVNISMYKTNGQKLNKMAGIAVYDNDVGNITPDYYFFLDTINPNSIMFRNKFKNDFETFYSDFNGYDYGYYVDVDSIHIPHENLHVQGTNMFVVSFINTYNNTITSNNIPTNSSNNKFAKPQISDGSNIYYVYSNNIYNEQQGTGLFPYLTYRTWRNSINTNFHEAVYSKDIGWGDVPNVDDVFANQHPNSNLKKLFKYTYNYIKTGYYNDTTHGTTDIKLDAAYEQLCVSPIYQSECNLLNISLESNINFNDNFILNNINTVSLTQHVFSNIDSIINSIP